MRVDSEHCERWRVHLAEPPEPSIWSRVFTTSTGMVTARKRERSGREQRGGMRKGGKIKKRGRPAARAAPLVRLRRSASGGAPVSATQDEKPP